MPNISPNALANVRRRKRARRLFRDCPLFAVQLLAADHEGYDANALWDDLTIKTKRRREKFKKTPLSRYGRYQQIQSLIYMWQSTREVQHLLQAQKLQKVITKPYRIRMTKLGQTEEYQLPATTSYAVALSLMNELKTCRTIDECNTVYNTRTAYSSAG